MNRTVTLIALLIFSSSIMFAQDDYKAKFAAKLLENKKRISLENRDDRAARIKSLLFPITEMGGSTDRGVQLYRLDSIIEWKHNPGIIYEDHRNVFVYNYDGKIIEETISHFYVSPFYLLWRKVRREITNYNINGQTETIINRSWNDNIEEWESYYRAAYKYDANGNLTVLLEEYWDKNLGMWVGEYRETYTYDENGNSTGYIYSSWSKGTNQWENQWKYEMIFNGTQLTGLTDYSWDDDDNEWVPNWKEAYTFDNVGQLTSSLSQSYDDDDNEWYNDHKNDISFNTNGSVEKFIELDWDDSENEWVAQFSYEFTYNAVGMKTSETSFYWDDDDNVWVEKYKEKYTYDAAGNMIKNEKFNWNDNINQWSSKDKYEYVYDNAYTYKDLVIPDYYYELNEFFDIWSDHFYFLHMILERIDYDWDDSDSKYYVDNTEVYYYSMDTYSSVEEYEEASVEVYPNPTADIINLKLANIENAIIEVMDISGKIIFAKDIRMVKQIDMTFLQSGIYFYRVNHNNKQYTGKIIKE